MEFTFEPIGVFESPYREKFGTPRQPNLVPGIAGTIVLRPNINSDAFDGLSEFSHAWIVFVFHEDLKNEKRGLKTKVHPPRLEGKAMGVFATRSPHRPNPIGLSLVKIKSIDGRRLNVIGHDLLHDTPILDVKPYLKSIESIASADEGWVSQISPPHFVVHWTESALDNLAKLNRENFESIKTSLTQLIQLDPRPVAYRGTVENPDPYTAKYGFRHGNWNVTFSMQTSNDGQKLAVVESVLLFQ